MELVIFSDSQPVDKKAWNSDLSTDRTEWNEIAEVVTNWFCYSNGIRKELKLSIIISDLKITLDGEYLRYLAPNMRSALSILYNSYNGHQKYSKKKRQPGVIIDSYDGLEAFVEPHYSINLVDNHPTIEPLTIDIFVIGTIFCGVNSESMNQINIPAKHYAQALNWLIYG